jgi:PD-(D/E)XK nuclease superfamily
MTGAPRLPVVTNSQLRTLRRCTREHHYRYDLGVRVRLEADALRFGTLMHLALEAWWTAEPSVRLARALDVLHEHALDPYELARATALMVGYHTRWDEDEHFEVIAVEAEFVATLVNPATGGRSRTYDLAGKIDVIVRRANGQVWIVEHKTTSEDLGPGSIYWQRLQIDPQVSMYFVGGRALGYDIAGCLYDVIKKPRQTPHTATPEDKRRTKKDGSYYADVREEDETPEAYEARLMTAIEAAPDAFYQRGEVMRLDQEERDAAHDTWQTVQALQQSRREKRYPRNPDGCERFHRMCDYFGVCTGQASIEDACFVRTEHVHTELSIAR